MGARKAREEGTGEGSQYRASDGGFPAEMTRSGGSSLSMAAGPRVEGTGLGEEAGLFFLFCFPFSS